MNGRQRAAERTGVAEIIEIEELKEMSLNGMSREQIADYYGVTVRRLNQIFVTRPDFKAAFDCGKAKGIRLATNCIMDKIREGNLLAAMFYSKCNAGWCEEQYRLKEKREAVKSPEVMIYLPENHR